jgi:hypothetical protein
LCKRLEKGEKYASGVNIGTSKARAEGDLLCGGGSRFLGRKYYLLTLKYGSILFLNK